MNNKKKDVLKEIMLHRRKVSLKMNAVANDISANGRRHDNSYTGDVEYKLLEKIKNSTDPDKKAHYRKLLDSIHARANDYHPDYHGGVEGMNMIQLIEYIADRIARIDARKERPTTLEEYKKEVIESLEPISYDLSEVVSNTVEYFLDRNSSILKSLNKQVANNVHQPMMVENTPDMSSIHSKPNDGVGGMNYGA